MAKKKRSPEGTAKKKPSATKKRQSAKTPSTAKKADSAKKAGAAKPHAAVLFDQGEKLVDAENYAEAVISFEAAWVALSEPKEEQDQAIPIMAAISDCYFHLKNWEACHNAMQHALRCGAALDNLFVRLRLGQSLYELGNEREAANWLVPVYLTEGSKPFANDDPKYLEFFRSQLRPPEGGWPEGW